MTERHIHKYKKVKLGHQYWVFRCMMPGCSHYIAEKLVLGKISICWRCVKPFLITAKHIKLTRPHCDDCTRRTNAKVNDIRIDDAAIQKLLNQ